MRQNSFPQSFLDILHSPSASSSVTKCIFMNDTSSLSLIMSHYGPGFWVNLRQWQGSSVNSPQTFQKPCPHDEAQYGKEEHVWCPLMDLFLTLIYDSFLSYITHSTFYTVLATLFLPLFIFVLTITDLDSYYPYPYKPILHSFPISTLYSHALSFNWLSLFCSDDIIVALGFVYT